MMRELLVRFLLIVILLCCHWGRPGEAQDDVYLELTDRVLVNHSLVILSDIGSTLNTSLRCVTKRIDCCSGGTGPDSDEDIADWFSPLGRKFNGLRLTRSRRGEGDPLGFVQLRRKDNRSLSPDYEGIYHCIIPKPGPTLSITTIFVGIYNFGNGQPIIADPIQFTLQSSPDVLPPVFTLTCASTGGPATTVAWTLNSSPIIGDINHVSSQMVVTKTAANYCNALTVTVTSDEELGSYQCTVANAAGNSSSAVFKGAVPSSPTIESLTTTDPTSVRVYWRPLIEETTLLKYVVSVQRATGGHKNDCEKNHHSNLTIPVGRSVTEYNITDLENFTTYIIGVTAMTVFGASELTIQKITTLPSAPTGAPQGLQSTATGDTSITIKWGAVECIERNSLITQYVVQYGPANGSSSVSETVCGTPEDGGVYTIVDLSTNMQYFVQVAAMNDNGQTGPFSDPILAESKNCQITVTVLVGVGVGCSLAVALLYTLVLGITVCCWKYNNRSPSIELKDCSAYSSAHVMQPKADDEYYNIFDK